MTTVDYILIIIAIVIMVVGLYMIIRGILNRKNNSNSQAVIRDKNGIPIIPRHERKLVEESEQDIEQGETVITPDREHLQPVIHEDTIETQASENSHQHATESVTLDNYHTEDDAITESTQQSSFEAQSVPTALHNATEHNATKHNDTKIDETSTTQTPWTDHQNDDHEEDVFSTLASATEKLMPMIDTAQETEFDDNSPMLDHHLLAEADQDQNSPLNHAQENINITLVPKNQNEVIEGTTILSLVSQYGLKYGAMNMFHRYENKDGSGILWFSMMGITHEGITPFDLNVLPTSKFNGLVLFLSLPHPKAVQGFDTMMSVVNLISNDLNANILDENNEILTRERRQQLRNEVQEYQAEMR